MLKVRSLRSRPGARQEVHLAGVIAEMAVSESAVPEGADVRFDGWIESAIGGVTVSGTATAPWSGTCRRCLEPASGMLAAEIRELCHDARQADRQAAGGSGGGLPVDWEEDDAYLVGPEELDVEPMVRDACILELPLAPLCSDSCRGLCPTCGANRNRDECSCDEPIDPRWSALAGLVPGEDRPDRSGRPEHSQDESTESHRNTEPEDPEDEAEPAERQAE